jgi:hypothetical protein
MDAHKADLETGRAFPKFARDERDYRSHDRDARIQVLWADGNEHDRHRALAADIWACECRASAARQFADFLESVADSVHNTPLREVARLAPPPQIMHGEKRVALQRVIEAFRVDGRRVYWKDSNGRKGWMAPAAWRKLPTPTVNNHDF